MDAHVAMEASSSAPEPHQVSAIKASHRAAPRPEKPPKEEPQCLADPLGHTFPPEPPSSRPPDVRISRQAPLRFLIIGLGMFLVIGAATLVNAPQLQVDALLSRANVQYGFGCPAAPWCPRPRQKAEEELLIHLMHSLGTASGLAGVLALTIGIIGSARMHISAGVSFAVWSLFQLVTVESSAALLHAGEAARQEIFHRTLFLLSVACCAFALPFPEAQAKRRGGAPNELYRL